MEREWFASWFDSPYYHKLYRDRNEEEAKCFIQALLKELDLPKGAKILDLACGKGRHSITLKEEGFNVIGADLSENSIHEASNHACDTLSFIVHDMREKIPHEAFDAIFNLFTSFGYFEDKMDNVAVLRSVHEMLRADGIFVIDFMNAQRVINTLVREEKKHIEGVDFAIKRSYDDHHIYKQIEFSDKGRDFEFTERVQALKIKDFEQLLSSNGFQILRTFGDFALNPFNEDTSDRLIIIAQRK